MAERYGVDPPERRLHTRSLRSWQRHLGHQGELSGGAAAGLRRSLARGTISEVAERTFRQRSGEVLLDVDGRQASGADLLRASATVASRLSSAGVVPRSRVLVALPSSVEFVACYLGVLRSGCSAVLANPALTKPELEGIVAVGAPAAGLVSPAVADALAGVRSAPAAQMLSPESVLVGLAAGRPAPPGPPGTDSAPGPGDEALLAWTSGSTGAPKGVPLTHANLLSSLRAVTAAWRWTSDDVVVHCLPLFHQHGLGSVHALALGGGRTVIRSRFDPDELARTIHAQKGSVLLAVPAIYQRLVEAAPGPQHFTSLRLAVSGSAPLSPPLFDAIVAATGIEPLERYGMTESGLDVSNLCSGPRKPGAVGFALPGVEVVVVGPDGAEVEPGTDGEICFRGPQVFSGYLGAGEEKQSFDADGWLRSGDIGRVDPDDGTLSLTGRAKDVIISGGMNVYPREVELVVEEHPGVVAVAVGGVPSERWGEAVYAFVVLRGGFEHVSDELADLCRRSLAPYKRPKEIVVVDELPRNHMGKIVRSALAPLARDSQTPGEGMPSTSAPTGAKKR